MVSALSKFVLVLLALSVFANLASAQTCGTLSSPNGKCQYGTCQYLTTCEAAASCTPACTAAGVSSCFVCVSPIDVAMCNLKNEVLAVSGILALLLFVLGGGIYLFGNMLPGPLKGNAHSYSIVMIAAAIAALAIFALASPIVSTISGVGSLYLIAC